MTKDIILFVNAIRPATFTAIDVFAEQTGRVLTPLVIVDAKIKDVISECNGQLALGGLVNSITANFDSASSITKALAPYKDRLLAVTSQYENSILELRKLIPNVPYLHTPCQESLDYATEKKLMRQKLEAYDKNLVPGYIEVGNSSEPTLRRIEQNLSYPMVVKPSGLEGSLLVSLVNNRTELKATLKHTFTGIQKAYDTWIKRQAPAVLVEEFMDGDMYSVDTYVAKDGTCRHTPPVHVVTGKKVGFDDFFGYMRIVPTGLSPAEIAAAQHTAEMACMAVGLRSITAHVELMKIGDKWKIIELGPRIGGYRHDMYNLSYGINHIMNDILNRAGETPIIPTEIRSHTAMFNIYAHQEGILTGIRGLSIINRLASFVSLKHAIKVGSEVRFAKNNGDPVLEVLLSNSDQAQLTADIRRLEQMVRLGVKQFDATKPAKPASLSLSA